MKCSKATFLSQQALFEFNWWKCWKPPVSYWIKCLECVHKVNYFIVWFGGVLTLKSTISQLQSFIQSLGYCRCGLSHVLHMSALVSCRCSVSSQPLIICQKHKWVGYSKLPLVCVCLHGALLYWMYSHIRPNGQASEKFEGGKKHKVICKGQF